MAGNVVETYITIASGRFQVIRPMARKLRLSRKLQLIPRKLQLLKTTLS